MVCPAYQSAFIYDKEELRKKFSYFQPDSTPKQVNVKKTKYLVAEPMAYRQKERSLKTITAKAVRPIVPDSLLVGDSTAITASLDKAARSVMDTTFIPDNPPADELIASAKSDYVITLDREVRVLKFNSPDTVSFDPASGKYRAAKPSYYVKEVGFNVDQGNYLWYLRDVLVLPDVRLAKLATEQKKTEAKRERKGLKGFFANLFGKKKKDKIEEEQEKRISPDLEEYNFDDFDDNRPAVTEEAAAGTSASKPKKSSAKKQKAPNQKGEAKPAKTEKKLSQEEEEEEDDGF
jgi:hypothetical protein